MKAVSTKNPWAYLIALGIKDIENRTWQTRYRGKIYIHASAKIVKPEFSVEQSLAISNRIAPEEFMPIQSAIIGEAEIIDCVINHPSIWAEKTDFSQPDPTSIWNWVLANQIMYDRPILNVKGKLSFWEPDIDIVECIGCSQKLDSAIMEEDDAGEKYCSECWEELSPIMAKEYKEFLDSQ